jgi:GNAT superfamily N-acetyltransferase
MELRHTIPERAELIALYDACGWSSYTKEPDALMLGFQQSLDVITMVEDDHLVGLIRTIGDGATILYIQDLLVDPAWRRQGIATRLVHEVLARHKDVRQIVLTTDDDPDVRAFYEHLGFDPYDRMGLVGFYYKKGA